jgi:L-asparaginase
LVFEGEKNMTNFRHVVILGTGGTIAGQASRASDNIGYTAAQVSAAQLVAQVPGLQGLSLAVEQVVQVDSKDMCLVVWQALLARVVHHLGLVEVQGIVITHGTDTLEETAFFLHTVLGNAGLLTKPVVLTCAMRPASSQSPDGPQNLLDAVTVVRDTQACGVLVVCAGVVHAAADVQKTHTYRVDAFSSGDGGPLGFVEESAVCWGHFAPKAIDGIATNKTVDTVLTATRWPRVEIVLNHADADGYMVDLLLQHRAVSTDGVQGLIVAGTGNGTLHVDLLAAVLRAKALGVRVWRSSRCVQGRVIESVGADHAGDTHLPGTGALSPVKARILMMLQLLSEQVATSPAEKTN